MPQNNVSLLPNFIDLDHFSPRPPAATRETVERCFGHDDGAPIILHMSNFRAVKRAADAVEIVRALHRSGDEKLASSKLVLVGDGPERSSLKALAHRHLGDSACIVSAVNDPAPWFRDADALLLPSETESFGLVALEALACGTPVVASRTGGLVDWLTDVEAATLCPVGDIPAFAAALARIIPPLSRTSAASDPLRCAARLAAERVGSASAAADVAESLYRQLKPSG